MSSLIFDSDTQGLSVVKEEEINEATGKSEKKYKIRGVFSTIGEKNRNGRTYPRPLWERNVAEYQNEIKSGSINTLMEYEHPARTEVDPMKAVSKITKLWIEGQYVMGEAVLLDNPQANQLKSLVDNDVKEIIAPLVYIVPLQLIAYYITIEKGHDPDKPKNLAKCVTVE